MLEELSKFLRYDPDSGYFTWTKKRRGHQGGVKPGNIAGCVRPDGRMIITCAGQSFLASRLAWLFVHGKWPDLEIDHINGDESDNRIVNLRDVSRAVNQQNMRRAKANNKLGILGVCRQGSSYRATIVVNWKQISLGRFDTAEEAHSAYLKAKRRLHDGCTI